MMMTKAFIFFNGVFDKNPDFYSSLGIKSENLFCADGGANFAKFLNIPPCEVWGDFDSLDSEVFSWLKSNKTILKQFDKDKDFTDGELLIQYVTSLNYDKIYVIGGCGGRTDHFLTNLNLLFKYKNLIFKSEFEEIFSIENIYEFKKLKNFCVSFIPFSDKVTNLSLEGFKYPLKNYTLYRGDSLCMSNIITSDLAKVRFEDGKLITIINFN